MIIEFPYPDKSLMPNRKNGSHWSKTKDAKVNAMNEAFWITKQAVKAFKFKQEKLALTITYIQNDKRHRDLDNLLAGSKAILDGMAKALGVDDKLFEPITIQRGYNKLKNSTIIELTQ